MSAPLPFVGTSLTDGNDKITPPWLFFLQQLVNPTAAPSTPTIASGSSFVANGNGQLILNGTGITSITFARKSFTIPIPSGPNGAIIGLVNNDKITVSYTGALTASFVPG